MGRLQAENPLVPKGIMGEANILNLEFFLPGLPLRRPEMAPAPRASASDGLHVRRALMNC
jgi:hypothetical protein